MSASQPKTHDSVVDGGSAVDRYRKVVVGGGGIGRLLHYEFCVWMRNCPGALGLFLRKTFWPSLFRSCGRGTVFGTGIVLRHPGRIELGERVVVGDGCILDARNEEAEVALSVGDDTMLGPGVMISCKGGHARIGDRCGLGARTIVHAVHGSDADLGDELVIGPNCYIAGGGNYRIDDTAVPISQQGLRSGEHVRLQGDNWLGAGVTVLPGVTLGKGSVCAAGSVVDEDVPAMAVCVGVPARVVRDRRD